MIGTMPFVPAAPAGPLFRSAVCEKAYGVTTLMSLVQNGIATSEDAGMPGFCVDFWLFCVEFLPICVDFWGYCVDFLRACVDFWFVCVEF